MGASSGKDIALARAFERGDLPNDGFHHTHHLRVAWVYLDEHATVEDATSALAAAIRRFAESAGKAEKFDMDVTIFWMHALADARAAMPDASLDDILAARPELRDKTLPGTRG